jgi:cell division transport system permease protein
MAAEELTAELGEDFTGFLGYNPLFSSIDVKLFAPYTNTDSLLLIEKEFLEYPQVKEVYFQKDLVSAINKNIKKISLVLLVVSGLLAFIFVALINNTIRISIYSQRFTINTMQMVGATNGFIRKPFLIQSFIWGIYGAVIANLFILAGVYSIRSDLEEIISLNDFTALGIVVVLVFLLGLFISGISTWFAVNKFLKMKFDELF